VPFLSEIVNLKGKYMGKIHDYLTDLGDRLDRYEGNWVLPYGSAYAQAYDSFSGTLKEQAELDKLKAEIFITAVSLGFGAGLGALFGKAALKAVVADQAINLVCERNMVRTFNAMAKISGSVPGAFLAEQAWDLVAGKAADATKKVVENMFLTTPGLTSPTNPQRFQNDLKQYLVRAKTAAHAFGEFVRDSSDLTNAKKDDIAESLRRAAFFKNAPTTPVIKVVDTAAEAIELSFYMVLVMNSDYIQETRSERMAGEPNLVVSRRVGDVNRPTTDTAYGDLPKSSYSRGGFGPSISKTYSIEYDRPGSVIMSRINKLHKKIFGGEFAENGWFGNSYGRTEIARAETSIEALNKKVLKGF
jgi:hypothetical protein